MDSSAKPFKASRVLFLPARFFLFLEEELEWRRGSEVSELSESDGLEESDEEEDESAELVEERDVKGDKEESRKEEEKESEDAESDEFFFLEPCRLGELGLFLGNFFEVSLSWALRARFSS